MSNSIFENIFLFLLILAGAWCVQYSFASLFDSLINDCLPVALGKYSYYYRSLSFMERILQLVPFVIFCGLICFLISAISELAVLEASQSLYKKKMLKKYCLDETHQAFFSQLLSFVILLITPGWLTIESVMWKFLFILLAGGIAMTAYLFLCMLASYCNDNGVRLLWGITALITFFVTWMVSGKFLFSAAFVLISLFMIPLRDWFSHTVDHLFSQRSAWLFDDSEEDEFDPEE